MANCGKCGKKFGFLETGYSGYCYPCYTQEMVDSSSSEEKQAYLERRELDAKIDAILITTETQPDINIQERITIVTAECAYGMNVFKDLFAGVRNIIGGRSEAVQKTMRDARETVLYELKREAHSVGANAVVAVDLDYTQIGDSGWGMVLLVASGTAVVIDDPAD